MINQSPSPEEYNDYYGVYIAQVPEGDLLAVLTEQRDRIVDVLSNISPSKENFRYEEGKWTTKEVVGHMLDTEWVFSYRTLRIARGDATPLAGMNQDEFVSGGNFADRSLASMIEEFKHLRSASIELISTFSDDILSRTGIASGFPFTVRALAYIIAGHAEHHLTVLGERYL